MYKTAEAMIQGSGSQSGKGSTILPPRDTWQPLETLLAATPEAAPGLSGQSAGMFLNPTVQRIPQTEHLLLRLRNTARQLLKDMAVKANWLLRDHHNTLIPDTRLTARFTEHPQSRAWQTLIFICV